MYYNVVTLLQTLTKLSWFVQNMILNKNTVIQQDIIVVYNLLDN